MKTPKTGRKSSKSVDWAAGRPQAKPAGFGPVCLDFHWVFAGGRGEDRTRDLCIANAALYAIFPKKFDHFRLLCAYSVHETRRKMPKLSTSRVEASAPVSLVYGPPRDGPYGPYGEAGRTLDAGPAGPHRWRRRRARPATAWPGHFSASAAERPARSPRLHVLRLLRLPGF